MTMAAPVSDMRKRALDALEERFKAAKAKLDQVDQSSSSSYPQKDLVNPSSPPQLASSQKGKPALSSGSKSQQKVSHSFDGDHPLYSEISEAVHENLLQGVPMDTDRRDAVEKILIDIMRKGDESGSSVNGAKKLKKENWVLLDNYLPKDDNSLANARAKSLKSHSKRSKNHMSMKQHRQCGSFKFPREFHNFERFKPMHAMWKEYICELVKDTGKKQLSERLLTADLHGAFLSVVESKTLSFGGISGIMVRETTETFGIVTQNNRFKVLFATAAASVADATAKVPLEAPLEGLSLADDLLCPFQFNFTSCWVSIAKVDGCAVELIKSITSFKVSISADCCNAVSDVSEKCFSIFGGLFAPLLRSHCIAFFPNASFAESPRSSA